MQIILRIIIHHKHESTFFTFSNELIRLIYASHNFNANNLNSFRGSLISNEEA